MKIKYKDKTYTLIENIVYAIFNDEIPLNDPQDTTERIVNIINNNNTEGEK